MKWQEKIRKQIMEKVEEKFPVAISTKEVNRYFKWQKGKK